jgi:hypothetical protein
VYWLCPARSEFLLAMILILTFLYIEQCDMREDTNFKGYEPSSEPTTYLFILLWYVLACMLIAIIRSVLFGIQTNLRYYLFKIITCRFKMDNGKVSNQVKKPFPFSTNFRVRRIQFSRIARSSSLDRRDLGDRDHFCPRWTHNITRTFSLNGETFIVFSSLPKT